MIPVPPVETLPSATPFLQALTAPERWGLERVVVMFAEVVRAASQTVLSGDLVRRLDDGTAGRFICRLDGTVVLEPIEDLLADDVAFPPDWRAARSR